MLTNEPPIFHRISGTRSTSGRSGTLGSLVCPFLSYIHHHVNDTFPRPQFALSLFCLSASHLDLISPCSPLLSSWCIFGPHSPLCGLPILGLPIQSRRPESTIREGVFIPGCWEEDPNRLCQAEREGPSTTTCEENSLWRV